MLKRLSLPFHSNSTSDLPAQLYTDHPQPSPYSLTPELSSNGYFPHSGPPSPAVLPGTDLPCNNALSIERPALNKSLRCLELLLTALDEYKQLTDLLARAQRKIAKTSKDLANCLRDDLPKQQQDRDSVYNTLTASASLFEAVAEVDAKFAKIAQKTFDNANEVCGKSFKKIAREERDHDELMANIDYKLKKASLTYDKRMRSGQSPASNAFEHNKHVQLLTALNTDLSAQRTSHGQLMRARRDFVIRISSRGLADLADSEFKRMCEGVRKAGKDFGRLTAWANLVHTEATQAPLMPEDLPSEPSSVPTATQEPQPPRPLYSNRMHNSSTTSIPQYKPSRPSSSTEERRSDFNAEEQESSPDTSRSDASSIPLTAGTRFSSLQLASSNQTAPKNNRRVSSPMNFVVEEEADEEPERPHLSRTLSMDSTDSRNSSAQRERYLQELSRSQMESRREDKSPRIGRPSLPSLPSSAPSVTESAFAFEKSRYAAKSSSPASRKEPFDLNSKSSEAGSTTPLRTDRRFSMPVATAVR